MKAHQDLRFAPCGIQRRAIRETSIKKIAYVRPQGSYSLAARARLHTLRMGPASPRRVSRARVRRCKAALRPTPIASSWLSSRT